MSTFKHDSHRFCIAPMMDWSDTHCRYLWRIISKHALLYTEMVTTGAILYGDKERVLRYNPQEQPLALQLGGSSPKDLSQCCKIAEQAGFQEINLNCGCPSDRVQSGKIGACLMAEPERVGDCVDAMQNACNALITVKHRIGIDQLDSQEHLYKFVDTVAQAGCTTFIVHARKAWLSGLSPKQNREIPPLDYKRVIDLKQHFSKLNIVINGGISALEHCQELLDHVDGVMVGREAYNNPYMLSNVDSLLFGSKKDVITRDQVLDTYIEYCKDQTSRGTKLHHMTRHILSLYQGVAGARKFRRHISENIHKSGTTEQILIDARQCM